MFRYGASNLLETLRPSHSISDSLPLPRGLRWSQMLWRSTRIARHPHISYHSGRLGNALTGNITA